EFQFPAGNINFHSTSYDWLVVTPPWSQFQGSGTINGVGGYKFQLTTIDGQWNGGTGQDTFRMRIWNASTLATVYDNEMGSPVDANPTTLLGGGNINLHKTGNGLLVGGGATQTITTIAQQSITPDVLRSIVRQAIAAWGAAGIDAHDLAVLNKIPVIITD